MSRRPPTFLKCLMALGSSQNQQGEIQLTATGFLYGYIPPKEIDKGYHYLVTNRHVLKDVDVLYLRLNPAVERNRARHYAYPLLDKHGKLAGPSPPFVDGNRIDPMGIFLWPGSSVSSTRVLPFVCKP